MYQLYKKNVKSVIILKEYVSVYVFTRTFYPTTNRY